MKTTSRRHILSAALVAALGIGGPVALAQATSERSIERETVVIDDTAAGAPTRAGESIAQDFSTFVGSETDSLALVEGLRAGTPVTLEDETTSTTITPAAPMGYGNVFTTLALAQASLAEIGITEPTAEELGAAGDLLVRPFLGRGLCQ